MPHPVTSEDREPERHVGYLIRRAQQRHVALWAETVSTEITSVQYAALAVLDRSDASQRELGDAVDLDRSTIADLVARMERRGLVERRRSSTDARRNAVSLTGFGRAERLRLRPAVETLQERLTAGLDAAELDGLVRGLHALLR
ncbi:MAG: MarR family winged helix-turn-helix transcriptional regulator [Microbacterium sp.]|uniref:MarR family winged helix-turn-helix transcriptional regulator n=1 Tax=Microbacterium sp. TaxID=51671 RepID=UPI0039E476BC